MSVSEIELWHRVMADVEPIEMKSKTAGSRSFPSGDDNTAPGVEGSKSSDSNGHVIVPPAKMKSRMRAVPITLDRRTRQKLQRGQFPIAARLDLHGMTQARAHAALTEFIQRQSSLGARCVLVITGVGLRTGGVLRSLTPRWLDEPPIAPLVLATSPASLRHGGDGAIYVMLRRRRDGEGNAT